jgi:hypothetical protein
MNRTLVMAACVASVLLLAGSVASAAPGPPVGGPLAAGKKKPNPSAKKKPNPAAEQNPFGEACRQTGKRRERDCPAWVEYDLIAEYEGTEDMTFYDSNKQREYESARTITWKAKSTKPVRVYRPAFRGTPFALSAVVSGPYNSSTQRSEYKYCQQTYVVREGIARAFDGKLAGGVGLRLAGAPRDNAIAVSGSAFGGLGIVYHGNVPGPTRFSPPSSWICTQVPNPKEDIKARDQWTSELSFPTTRKPKGERKSGSSAMQFGDGLLSGASAGSESTVSKGQYGTLTKRTVKWTWNWVLSCRETAKGNC